MSSTRSSFVDKVLGRIDRLSPDGLQKVVQRLARERDFLDTLFNTIEDGIMVVDAQGRISYFNQAVTRLLGLQADSAEGQPVARFLPGLDWQKVSSLDQAGGRSGIGYELEVDYPRPRLLSIFAAPIDGDAAGSRGVAFILHDATEARRRTHEAIETERSQALTLLAASVAHEIGNPLNALHIHLQLMERELRKLRVANAELAEPASRKRRSAKTAPASPKEEIDACADRLGSYLGVARGEIGRLDYIITQFLQALRPAPPKLQPAQLNEVVRETVELLRPELDNRGLVVQEKLARQLPDASMDPAQIKQALVNLVKNSMQAMTRGGILSMETGILGDGVWVSIADNGVGIPPERLNRIFEPFFTTKKKGTGLGLMIVSRIIRDHGGRIDVESHAGKGTTFRLWLPLNQRRQRLLEQPAPAPTDQGPEAVAPAG